MRVAVISDVHGNAFALEAVLKEIKQASPDLIINLGDQIEGSADPARAAALQAELGALEIRGNNEEKLWPDGRQAPISIRYGEFLDQHFTQETYDRLATLPLTTTALDGKIFACHGTPTDAWRGLLWEWTWRNDNAKDGFYLTRDPRELLEIVRPLNAEILLCGHTHRSGMTQIGDTLVINSGSVSDQIDNDPRARWTLIEHRQGHWNVQFRAVEYDFAAAVAWSEQHSPFDSEFARLKAGVLI